MFRKLRYILLAGVAALAVPPALAEPCGNEDVKSVVLNLNRMLAQGISKGEAQIEATRIGVQARNCPDTAWIRLMAAGAEISMLERHEASDPPGLENLPAQRFEHVERAVEHLEFFRLNRPEDFRHGTIHLGYDEWAGVADMVMQAMLRFAEKGHVHPLVSETPPPLACDYIVKRMATTASGYLYNSSFPALNFLNAAADVCRTSEYEPDWSVLFQRAEQLTFLVKEGHISDPLRIRWALREAYRDSRQYLNGRPAPYSFWAQSDETALMDLIAQHNVSLKFFDENTEIPRTDWFTPENVSSENTVYSIGLAISRLWTPLAAGVTDAELAEVTQARGAVMTGIREFGAEADAAGQTAAGRRAILEAVSAFQSGDIRTPETAALPGMPDWMFRVIEATFQNRIDEAG
jgi:hypothetical protein